MMMTIATTTMTAVVKAKTTILAVDIMAFCFLSQLRFSQRTERSWYAIERKHSKILAKGVAQAGVPFLLSICCL